MTRILTTCISLMLLMYGCHPSQPIDQTSEPGRQLVLSMNGQTPLILPFLIAAESSNDKSAAIEIQRHSTGRDAVASVLSGHSDFAVTSETPLVHAYSQGQKFKVIATYVRSKTHLKCVARRDKGIEKPSDLTGKQLGTAKGTNFEYFMRRFLEKNEVPFDESHFLNLSLNDMVGALVSGRVDAVFLHEPYISRIRSALPEDSLTVFHPDDVYDLTYNIIVADPPSKAATPENQAALLRLVRSTIASLEHEKERAIGIAGKEAGIDEAVMRTAWPEYRWGLTLDDSLTSLLRDEAEWLTANETERKWPLPKEEIGKVLDSGPLAAAQLPPDSKK